MEAFEKVIQKTTERLYEDERLRSNLSDDEAQVVLGWAEEWVAAKITRADDENGARQIAQSELNRVRQAVSTMNTLAENPGALRLSEMLAAFEPQMRVQSILPRVLVFKILTRFITTMWATESERAAMLSSASNRSAQ